MIYKIRRRISKSNGEVLSEDIVYKSSDTQLPPYRRDEFEDGFEDKDGVGGWVGEMWNEGEITEEKFRAIKRKKVPFSVKPVPNYNSLTELIEYYLVQKTPTKRLLTEICKFPKEEIEATWSKLS